MLGLGLGLGLGLRLGTHKVARHLLALCVAVAASNSSIRETCQGGMTQKGDVLRVFAEPVERVLSHDFHMVDLH